MEADMERKSMTRYYKSEDDQPRSRMESLPHEIILNILTRLPITSLVQFRSVSRSWNLLSHDPDLVELHYSKAAKENTCLILHSDYPIRNLLYFVELSDKPGNEIVRRIQTPFQELMPEFHVLASCNGLLCLSDSLYGDPVRIYNPFTRQHKELPKSRQFEDQDVVFGFGFHPMNCEYKVVKIVFYWITWNQYVSPLGHHSGRRLRVNGANGSEVQVCSLGDPIPYWRSIGSVPYYLEGRTSETLVNGRLHWLTQPEVVVSHLRCYQRIKRIISFDLADEKFREVPRPECGVLDRCKYHLAVLGGCLSAVVCDLYDRYEIWVMKEYGVKESWIREFLIKDFSSKLRKPLPRKSYGIWRTTRNQKLLRVLCLLKNGNVLIEYEGEVLVSYDPVTRQFEKLLFPGMPDMFQAVVHIGSLKWIGSPVCTSRN